MTHSNETKQTNNPKISDTANPGNMYSENNSKPKHLEKKGINKKPKHVK